MTTKHSATYLGVPIGISASRLTTPVVGTMVYDANTSSFSIFDGANWKLVTAEMMAPNWPDQLTEDEILCRDNPGLAELKRQLDEAKEKYEAFKALVKE